MKVSGVAWHGDGFYYSRYPEPEKGKEKASINENHQVYFHKVGTPQSHDVLVYEDKDNPQRFHTVEHDRRRALRDPRRSPSAARARTATRSSCAISSKGETTFTPLVAEIGDDSFGVIDNVGDKLLVATEPQCAERARRPGRSRATRRGELDRRPAGEAGAAAGRRHRRRQAVRDLPQGRRRRARTSSASTASSKTRSSCPGLGTAGGFGGQRDDTDVVLHASPRLTSPPTIYRYDIATKKSDASSAQPKVPGSTRRTTRRSRSSTRARTARKVPMFLVHKKGLKLDGNNPTLLYGYGGFNIVADAGVQRRAARAGSSRAASTPSANLRGGGEYGETWHEAGHEAEEAERVRRLHRRGRVADREQVHVDARSSRSRAARTAACSSAR